MQSVVLGVMGLVGLLLSASSAAALGASQLPFPGGAVAAQAPAAPAAPTSPSSLEVIESQLAAFNSHNVDALVANLAEDFVWYSVDRDAVRLELQGREAFRRSMVAYFAAYPEARTELDDQLGGGQFVAVRERAFWPRPDGGEQSQASLAVYQVRDGLIHGVWYYPVEVESTDGLSGSG